MVLEVEPSVAAPVVESRVASRLVAWERAYRRARRAEHLSPPGQASDTSVLLAGAEADAMSAHMDDIGVLQTIDADVQRTHRLVADRAELIVELAQSEGEEATAEKEREDVVERASQPDRRDEVDRELEAADESLGNSLGMLLKNDTGRDFHRLKGTLLPPVSAAPTYSFGPRKQKGSLSYVRHTGVTWKVPKKTDVEAVTSGLVVFAGRFEGFGKMLIIDHGQNYHSIYAHLGSLAVEVGQKVARGQRLGASGATGSFEGPKLYFELRKDGKPIDPTPWFIQR